MRHSHAYKLELVLCIDVRQTIMEASLSKHPGSSTQRRNYTPKAVDFAVFSLALGSNRLELLRASGEGAEIETISPQNFAVGRPQPATMAIGAVAGAAVGGLMGASVGNGETARRSAGAGATYGGTRSGVRALNESNKVVRNCLRNRGYAVLN